MEISSEGVPAETRWAIATKALSGFLTGHIKVIFDLAGKDKFEEIMEQIWSEAGKAAKQIADALGLPSNDVRSVVETFTTISSIVMGPEMKNEVVKADNQKAVVRVTMCPWWERVKELGIKEDVLTKGDEAYCNDLCRSLNPNVTVNHTKHMHLGDPECEWIFELKK